MGDHKADKLLNFSLLLFAASCILSITAAEGALVLMLLAILWKAFTSPEGFAQPLRELHANPLVFPLALYLVSYIFSSIFSLDQARSFSRLDTELIKAASALLLFSAVARCGREKAAFWFLAGAAAAALLGVGQFAKGLLQVSQGEQIRAHGTMIAVSYAETMGIALALAGALVSGSAGRLRKLYISLFFLVSLAFAATLSRGPALGLMLTITLLFFIQKDSRKFMLGALAVLLLTFAASASLNKVSRDRMTSAASFLSKDKSSAKLDTAAGKRLTMWKAGIDIFRDYPLTGTGPYGLRRVFNYYHHQPIDGKIDYPDLHNLYLQRAADSGVPGLLALLLLFGVILKSTVSSFLKFRDPFSLWGLAGFAGFAVMMLTDSSFDLPRLAFCVYLMAIIAGPAGRQIEKPRA